MSRHGEADHDDHGGDPVGGRQGSATGAEPDSRELQTTEDAAEHTRQHGWEGVGGDRQVDPQGDGSGEPSQEMTAVVQTAAMIRSAPLPAPHEFKGYEAVLPGAADRILRMAEKDQDSLIAARAADVEDRHTATRAEARAFVAAAWAVAFFPWILGVLTVGLLIAGRPVAASTMGIATALTAGPQIIVAARSGGSKERK